MTGSPPRQRRSLSHVGGAIEREGNPTDCVKLARALAVTAAPPPAARGTAEAADDPDRVHVHGFHSYPARMHPETAARLVEGYSRPGGTVLDPFCGSGTVLVEASRLGRIAIGTDLNPIAVLLASRKLAPRTEHDLLRLVSAAGEARAFADERRTRRAGATRRYPPIDTRAFAPHVLLELDSLRSHIHTIERGPLRDDLSLVLSAILIKVSNQQADTTQAQAPRRLAAGYTAKLFFRKAEELARRLREYRTLRGETTPTANVRPKVGGSAPDAPGDPSARSAFGYACLDDATKLAHIATVSIDAIITSPPYAATYDYLEHHALRLRWLDLDDSTFAAGELGARRKYDKLDATTARRTFHDELVRFFKAAKRVLRKRAALVLLIADSEVRGTALHADDIVAHAADDAGLEPVARASQARPHFHDRHAFADAPRREHALLLRTV